MAQLSKNVGGLDKWLRLVLGVVAVALGAYYQVWWLLIVGGLVFLSGLVGRCGLYYLLGINTCLIEKNP